jgi:heme-degrading monooxygenase HmoA
MEILIVTSAYTTREHNTDVLAQVQWIADTLPNAPGLISSHFYRNRENSSSYLMFTTWEDEESWQKAQERYNPKTLLQNSATRLLEPPEQWRMHYLWGYNRPAVTPTVIAVHLATVPPHQAEAGQQKWLNELRKQDLKLSLGFAFLARGEREEAAANKEKPPFAPAILENHVNPIGSVFLNFFSWSSETACRRFYASSAYKELDIFMRSINTVQQVLFLESMR